MTVAGPSDPTLQLQRMREFAFGDEDFEALRRLVKQLTGINLTDQKRELVYGRLSRRLRALNLTTFRDYRQVLQQDDDELVNFCNAITTNLTSFFRENHHFEYLRDHVLLKRANDAAGPRRIRIWSSACSTGEEPYSVAMTVHEALPDLRRWDIRVLATDLDSEVLNRAQRGSYGADRVQGFDPRRLERFFTRTDDKRAPAYQVNPDVAALITFKQLNLMHQLPMKGPLDVIFCRNVVIYFDKDTQRELFARMAKLQRPGDLLFLGHSESLFKVSTDYALIGKTVYRRV
jgi:chemotaxis protein methyltransferase CheR